MAPSTATLERDLASVLLQEFPDEAVEIVESADDAEIARLLEREPNDSAAAILRRLTPDCGARVLAALDLRRTRAVLPALNQNRAAAMLARLEPEQRERCLAALDAALARELRALAEYPPDSAGALMDPRVATFHPEALVSDAVKRLQRFRNVRISDVFCVDSESRLVGAVALEDVLMADRGARLESLTRGAPVSVQALAPREEVAETFDTHRLGSLPVVDFDGRLLGVLRQRELLRVAQEQATASAVTMVGASQLERALSSPGFAIRKRLPWLQINLLTAFMAAAVVGIFEETIAQVTALAVLMPVVAGQSGNTGAQALAITMRGLALREIRTRQWLRVVIKEVLAGAGNGLAVGATTAFAVYLWSDSLGLAAVIGVSMILSMSLAGLSGAAIPMILTALRQDPAQSSSIILTTITDVVGFSSFLGIATLLLQIL